MTPPENNRLQSILIFFSNRHYLCQMKLALLLVSIFWLPLQAQTRREEKLLEFGQQKAKEGKWIEAIDYFNQCLNTNPTLVEGYLLRANANEKLNKLSEALTDYSIAIEIDPQNAEANLSRGIIGYKLKRYDLALGDFRKLRSISTQGTNTVYFKQSNSEGFDKIFTVQSGIQDMVHNYLGLIEMQLGHYEKCILHFDSAIAINLRMPDYFSHRGLAYLELGNNEKASSDFNQALIIDPTHSASKNNLSLIKRKEGNIEESERLLNEAKMQNNKVPNHYSDLALLQMESNRFYEAVLNFDSAIATSPTDGELFISRGLAKEKIKDLDGAMKDYETALAIDAEWPKAWFVQGNIFFKKGQWQEALENYTAAIAFDEDYALAYYNRAIVHFKMGQKAKACSDLKTSEVKGMKVDGKMIAKFCDR